MIDFMEGYALHFLNFSDTFQALSGACFFVP